MSDRQHFWKMREQYHAAQEHQYRTADRWILIICGSIFIATLLGIKAILEFGGRVPAIPAVVTCWVFLSLSVSFALASLRASARGYEMHIHYIQSLLNTEALDSLEAKVFVEDESRKRLENSDKQDKVIERWNRLVMATVIPGGLLAVVWFTVALVGMNALIDAPTGLGHLSTESASVQRQGSDYVEEEAEE